MAGFALRQTFRNACPDVATVDLVARWAGFCISLLCIAVIGLFRALTNPGDRTDQAISLLTL